MSPWKAHWVSYAFDPREDLGVFCLRHRLNLEQVPEKLEVRVSADQRYKLFVGDQLVCFGPQRGDLEHWFYETVDLAPYLKPGENLIWALVWNFGWMAPMAQMTLRTAFVFDAADAEELNTPGKWEIARISNWDFEFLNTHGRNYYIEVGPGEIWRGGDWRRLPKRDDLGWKTPHDVRGASPRGAMFEPFWALIPRSIPLMRYDLRSERPEFRKGFIGDSEGGRKDHEKQVSSFSFGPDDPVLLDYQELLCAYPRLKISGPVGAEVTITYAEALWREDKSDPKGNRNEVAGKEIRGYQDKVVLTDGTASFEPLWWRTYRYLSLVSSATVEVEIEAVETGYPYEVESSFEADDPSVKPIWDVSVRTALRCAGETYFDCPYYEQLQYAGDTRIQALIAYYLGKDRALTMNAVDQFSWSIMDNGLTQSRYPNRITQVIPPFCLWWLLMQSDETLYSQAVRPWRNRNQILQGFRKVMSPEGVTNEAHWNFGDWVPTWVHGVPPGGPRSTMHRLTLDLARSLGFGTGSSDFPPSILEVRLQKDYVKTSDGLVAHRDDPDFAPCEHSEALYRILQQTIGQPADPWPAEALEKAGAAKTTYYFSYYKHLAMQSEDYMALLAPWKQMIEDGLTTFAENPAPVRSDCHAWSAHPILGFFQIVAGVTSSASRWSKARIAPNPGSLKRFDAKIAHPKGLLRVAYENDRLHIETPVVTQVIWKGKTDTLTPGTHQI